MHFLKPIVYTVFYVIFLELIGAWIYIAYYFDSAFLAYDYYYFINGLLMAISLISFTYFANKRVLRLPQSTSTNWYLVAITLGIAYIFVQTPLNWIYNSISGESYNIIYEFEGFGVFTNINLISSVLFIPIAEELFFREFLQKNLQKRTHAIIAIGICSLLFASIHLPYVNLIFDYPTFSFHHAYIALFGGLILGSVYYKSKSIGPSIVLHMLWNLMVILF